MTASHPTRPDRLIDTSASPDDPDAAEQRLATALAGLLACWWRQGRRTPGPDTAPAEGTPTAPTARPGRTTAAA